MLHKNVLAYLGVMTKIQFFLRIILTNYELTVILITELNMNAIGLLLVGRQNQILQKI